MFFTPQWNLGRKQKIWEKNLVKDVDADKYVSCFFVDIDIRHTDFAGHDECLEHIKKIVLERNLPVSYIVRSGWGWHIYMFIEESARSSKLLIKNYKAFQKEFANMFWPWGDESCINMARLIRMPFSFHWKTYNPIMVELYSVERTQNGLEIDKVTSEDQILPPISVYSQEHIEALSANLITPDISTSGNLSLSMRWDMNVVNKIEFSKVFFKLLKFPKDLWTELLTFNLNGIFIDLHYTNKETWEIRIVHTDGYRYNKKGNYVNNFSVSQHSIDDRPIWGVYSFLYHYFGKDSIMVRKFLKEAFSLDLWDESRVARNVMPPIVTESGTIFFTEKNVVYRIEKVNANWKIIHNEIMLFNIPMKVIGVMESKYHTKWETEQPAIYYLLERMDRMHNSEFIIQFQSSRVKFNDTYWSTGMIFTSKGDELLLLSFYDALNRAVEAWQIPECKLEYLNGWNEDYFVIWNNIILKDFTIVKKLDGVIMKTQPIDMALEWKQQITIWEFYTKLQDLFSERISLLSLLTYIMLFLWEWFWKPIRSLKQQLMLPALMLSWKTCVWKSTLIALLKEWSWISLHSKKLSIRSTTAQPLNQAASDNFLLHLEEFTWEIWQEKEDLLRNIVNKTNSARGLANGLNIWYTYRAGLVIDWERLPREASVLNRCIVCAMYEKDKKGTERMLTTIKPFSYLKDLIVQAYAMSPDDIRNAYLYAEDLLSTKWISSRSLEFYSYLLATNYLFSISEDNKAADILFENAWAANAMQKTDPLASFLSHVIVTKRIHPRFWNLVTDDGYTLEIPLTDDLINEKRIDITALIELYRDLIIFEDNAIKIHVPKSNTKFTNKMSQFYHYAQ